MEDADERRAWELLHNGDIAVINTEIIKRINDAERYKHLEWILRKVVSEELKALPLTLSIGAPQVRQQSDENENTVIEKRALSWQEFLDSGFDGRDYNFPDFEGTFEAEMVCKRWDKNSKLLVYLDFDDGRKIITSAWQDSNYKGLADVPFNTRVRVTFQYSKKGISYLRSAEVI